MHTTSLYCQYPQYEKLLETAKKIINERRSQKQQGNSQCGGWIYLDNIGYTQSTQFSMGCLGSLSNGIPYNNSIFYVLSHGDGPTFPPESFGDEALQGEIEKQVPWNLLEFTGTDRSLEWYKYILSDTSPWKDLLPWIIPTDDDFLNNKAILFIVGGPNKNQDAPSIPKKLWYNFLMAERFCWEWPLQFSIFRELCKVIENKNLALYIAKNFYPRPSSKGIEGPWMLVYPWSFLENVSLEAAYRFINSKPAHISEHAVPNTNPLWRVNNNIPTITPRISKLQEYLVNKEDLSLTEIIDVLNDELKHQELELAE